MRISYWSSDLCSSDLVRLHPGIFLTKPGRPAHPGKIQPAHPGRGVTDDRQSFDDGRVCPVLVADDPRHRRFQVLASARRSEEHTSELQSLMRISYAVFCLKKKRK